MKISDRNVFRYLKGFVFCDEPKSRWSSNMSSEISDHSVGAFIHSSMTWLSSFRPNRRVNTRIHEKLAHLILLDIVGINIFIEYLCYFRCTFVMWQVHPDEVQLLVALVNYKTKLVKPRRGLCSTWLASLDCCNKEIRVPVWIKKGTISFPKALDAPCLMIGPGTCNITM